MNTYAEILNAHDIEVPAHLVADAEVPVLTGMQRQGDVIVLPTRAGKVTGLVPVPPEGTAVVRGESGGNTHLLVADGHVRFALIENEQRISQGIRNLRGALDRLR